MTLITGPSLSEMEALRRWRTVFSKPTRTLEARNIFHSVPTRPFHSQAQTQLTIWVKTPTLPVPPFLLDTHRNYLLRTLMEVHHGMVILDPGMGVVWGVCSSRYRRGWGHEGGRVWDEFHHSTSRIIIILMRWLFEVIRCSGVVEAL